MQTVRACPLHAHWVDGEPVTDVLPMSGAVDRYRRFVVDALRESELVRLHGPRLSIGRAEGCGVALPWDPEVSRLHAVVERSARIALRPVER